MVKIKLMPSGCEDMPSQTCVMYDDNDKEIAVIPYTHYMLLPTSDGQSLVMHLYIEKQKTKAVKVAMIVGVGTTVQAYTVNADGGLSELRVKDKAEE